jgi:hypothetical protein
VPQAGLLEALGQDYQAMQDAQMFYGAALRFAEVVERLTVLEQEINRITLSSSS